MVWPNTCFTRAQPRTHYQVSRRSIGSTAGVCRVVSIPFFRGVYMEHVPGWRKRRGHGRASWRVVSVSKKASCPDVLDFDRWWSFGLYTQCAVRSVRLKTLPAEEGLYTGWGSATRPSDQLGAHPPWLSSLYPLLLRFDSSGIILACSLSLPSNRPTWLGVAILASRLLDTEDPTDRAVNEQGANQSYRGSFSRDDDHCIGANRFPSGIVSLDFWFEISCRLSIVLTRNAYF